VSVVKEISWIPKIVWCLSSLFVHMKHAYCGEWILRVPPTIFFEYCVLLHISYGDLLLFCVNLHTRNEVSSSLKSVSDEYCAAELLQELFFFFFCGPCVPVIILRHWISHTSILKLIWYNG
jgi:hypothetical protein